VVLAELGMVAIGWQPAEASRNLLETPIPATVSNTAALGQVLYTKYVIFFQASALVLLTAMIGAIVLTLHHKPNVKRQKIEEQNARNRHNVIEIKKVPFRTGV
jgi:NADH-quinone oxidoreductase subunit J